MSLTSYRAAPPRVGVCGDVVPAWWPGGDLLSRRLSGSTMGAGVFHGRVRDGIGCVNAAMGTRPPNPRGLARAGFWVVRDGWLWVGFGAACGVREGLANGLCGVVSLSGD